MEQSKNYKELCDLISHFEGKLCDIELEVDFNLMRRTIEEHFERCVHALEARSAFLLAQLNSLVQLHYEKTETILANLQKYIQDCKVLLSAGLQVVSNNALVADQIWQGAINLVQPSAVIDKKIVIDLPCNLIALAEEHGAVLTDNVVFSELQLGSQVPINSATTSPNSSPSSLASTTFPTPSVLVSPSSPKPSPAPFLTTNGATLPGPIHEWLPKRQFQLLYKATRDGFDKGDFQWLCRNKGPTICLITSKADYTFGGYTPIPWGTLKASRDSINPDFFIFTLTNPHSIPPTQYKLRRHDDFAKFEGDLHVHFGVGDIHVTHKDAHIIGNSYTEFGTNMGSYIDTTGRGNKTFTGSRDFTVKEIEVYRVI